MFGVGRDLLGPEAARLRPCSRTRRSCRRSKEAESTSRSPSPSTSAGEDRARHPSGAVEMTCWVPKLPAPSVFSYQAILSSESRPRARPIPVAVHVRRENRVGIALAAWSMICWVAEGPRPVRVLVPGDLAVEGRGGEHVQCPRPRPRPPRRPTGRRRRRGDHLLGPEAARPVRVLVPGDLVVVMHPEAESTSGSPSPSTSAAKTEYRPVRCRGDDLLGPEAARPRPCSRTRRPCRRHRKPRGRPVSPSPSTSAANGDGERAGRRRRGDDPAGSRSCPPRPCSRTRRSCRLPWRRRAHPDPRPRPRPRRRRRRRRPPPWRSPAVPRTAHLPPQRVGPAPSPSAPEGSSGFACLASNSDLLIRSPAQIRGLNFGGRGHSTPGHGVACGLLHTATHILSAREAPSACSRDRPWMRSY